MSNDLRYWDSDAFLGYFNNEPDKADACKSVLEAADAGKVMLVTSALTLAEVLYAKGHSKLDMSKRELIEQFFKSPFLSVQNVRRSIAEGARDIVWDSSIRPKDAIHVATALSCKIPVLNTFDQNLLKADESIGDPPLRIVTPHEPGQPLLPGFK